MWGRGVIALGVALAGLAACARLEPSPAHAREGAMSVAARVEASTSSENTASNENTAGAAPKLLLATAIEEPRDRTKKKAHDLEGRTVLHVGDSMVGGVRGLTRALEQKFTKEGAKFVRDYKVSESITSFDHSSRLRALLGKHRPDIVILTLGANDVFVPFPAALATHVQNIVKRVGARECYWMGPPTWKPDTGIVAVIRDNAAPCKFFDGSNMKLERASDGIHPTDRGGADWATSFWTFFENAQKADDDGR